MREVFRTAAFKRDYRRVLRSSHGIHVRGTLSRVVELLADDRPLPASYAEDKVWRDAADTPGFPFVHSIGRCDPATV